MEENYVRKLRTVKFEIQNSSVGSERIEWLAIYSWTSFKVGPEERTTLGLEIDFPAPKPKWDDEKSASPAPLPLKYTGAVNARANLRVATGGFVGDEVTEAGAGESRDDRGSSGRTTSFSRSAIDGGIYVMAPPNEVELHIKSMSMLLYWSCDATHLRSMSPLP